MQASIQHSRGKSAMSDDSTTDIRSHFGLKALLILASAAMSAAWVLSGCYVSRAHRCFPTRCLGFVSRNMLCASGSAGMSGPSWIWDSIGSIGVGLSLNDQFEVINLHLKQLEEKKWDLLSSVFDVASSPSTCCEMCGSRAKQQSCDVVPPVFMEQFVDVTAVERTSGRIMEHIVDVLVAHNVKDILEERISDSAGKQHSEHMVVLPGQQVVREILEAEIAQQMKDIPQERLSERAERQTVDVPVQSAKEIRAFSRAHGGEQSVWANLCSRVMKEIVEVVRLILQRASSRGGDRAARRSDSAANRASWQKSLAFLFLRWRKRWRSSSASSIHPDTLDLRLFTRKNVRRRCHSQKKILSSDRCAHPSWCEAP